MLRTSLTNFILIGYEMTEPWAFLEAVTPRRKRTTTK